MLSICKHLHARLHQQPLGHPALHSVVSLAPRWDIVLDPELVPLPCTQRILSHSLTHAKLSCRATHPSPRAP